MIFDKIKKIIVDELGVEEGTVKMEARFKEDLGADSLDAVELIMSIEEEFEISVDEDAIQNLKTVGDIVNYVESAKK